MSKKKKLLFYSKKSWDEKCYVIYYFAEKIKLPKLLESKMPSHLTLINSIK